ncbi:UNVERIFIED_CONTAM: hypothetical protein Slati_2212300 [Sesamum latifolium]|uniref:DUF4283 domain-containing protein n=1 Tax=Sesamum latifolium TaxID=2727402 RepID=A0AAW2WY81_9LAMI
MIKAGSKKWESTAIGYFLGRKPSFFQLNEFARSTCPSVKEVIATTNGFFFIQFNTLVAMEEVLEGGPWLFQGQPIVLQRWEPSMTLRKRSHTQVPIWIKLCHLPVELWTPDGLSTVASGVGRPLYPDAITKADCPSKKWPSKPPVTVFIQKQVPPSTKPEPQVVQETNDRDTQDCPPRDLHMAPVEVPMIRAASWNVRGLNRRDHQLVWFNALDVSGNRIWLLWDDSEIDVVILGYEQCIHSRIFVKRTLVSCLVSVAYGANDIATRRGLWSNLVSFMSTVDELPWLVMGDFNRVLDHRRLFRFDNYLAVAPGFLEKVKSMWQHNISGTPMYAVTRKLKNLKPIFRAQRKDKGDISANVAKAKDYLKLAQLLLQEDGI